MTLPRFNKTILACVLLLSGLGLLSLWTAAPPTTLAGESITRSIFMKQLTFMGVGLAVMALVAIPHYQLYRRLAPLLYVVGLLALAALLFKAKYTRGARGWFAVGPVNVQPAEFMKIAFILVLARVLMYGRLLQEWRGLLLPLIVTAVPAALIVVQPDLGTTLLFVPTLLAMLFAAGARKRHLAVIVGVLLAAAPLVYFYGMKPYQQNRLIAFAFRDRVPADMIYQVTASEKACASGSLIGRGLGESGSALPF